MRQLNRSLLVTLAAVLAFATCAQAGTVTINFDNLVGGTSIGSPTPVSNQYAGLGVTFSDPSGPMGALLGTVVAVTGYSPPNVLFSSQHQGNGDAGDLRLDFSVATQSVSMNGFLSSDYYMEAIAYDASSVWLGTFDTPAFGTYGVVNPLSISTSSPISYLLVTSHPSGNPGFFGNFSMDDLTFTTSSPTPEPQTLAMMMTGLGILGSTMKRRWKAGQR